MGIEPFIAAFALALVSEIADKTQLVILGLALRYKSPFKVFSGALLAHAFMDGVAIALGAFFGFSLASNLIKNIIGILFVLLGLWTLVKLYLKKSKKEKKEIFSKTPFAASFLTVVLSEFGDKTQIASGLLAAKYLVPVPIFIGFVLALAIVIGLNVFVGSKLAERIPRKTIKIVTAVLFVLFGIFTLVS
ncbi:MAG TPA: TMEM165/GDT1 family protein [Candidatus Nanoarchaeia archaeon]|nr:TMEM165/GDT1 family protein [Candidatus Nanoarchaeia archaeon]